MSEWLWLRKKYKLQFKSKLKSKLFSKPKWEQNQQTENKQKNIEILIAHNEILCADLKIARIFKSKSNF